MKKKKKFENVESGSKFENSNSQKNTNPKKKMDKYKKEAKRPIYYYLEEEE